MCTGNNFAQQKHSCHLVQEEEGGRGCLSIWTLVGIKSTQAQTEWHLILHTLFHLTKSINTRPELHADQDEAATDSDGFVLISLIYLAHAQSKNNKTSFYMATSLHLFYGINITGGKSTISNGQKVWSMQGTDEVVDYFWVQMRSVAWRSAFYSGEQMISPWQRSSGRLHSHPGREP